jgi:tetratricopeptide (TPR) repeat protein
MLALAEGHIRARRLREAELICRDLVHDFPKCAEGWNHLGCVMEQRKNALQAVAYIERAIAIAPQRALFHANLGEIYRRAGLAEQALTHARRALELDATDHNARLNLGLALLDLKRADEALQHFENVTERTPENVKAWFGKGRALVALKRFEEAVAVFRHCTELAPRDSNVWLELARARLSLNDPINALSDAKKLAEMRPRWAEAALVLADAYQEMGQFADAERMIRDALAAIPGAPELKFRLAQLRLAQGDFRDGFELYESRFEVQGPSSIRRLSLPMPFWRGENLAGKRILVLTEQGYGDHIQFCRFVGPLSKMASGVVFAVSPALIDLMRSLPGPIEITTEIANARASGCDYWTFLGSLPFHFKIGVGDIPRAPYLGAAAAKRARWRERLAGLPGRRRIGLVWAGSPAHGYDRRRSIPFERLSPLARVPDVAWINPQPPSPAVSANAPIPGLDITCFPDGPVDFDDTAALIAELDLLVSVDTSVAHLGGALGAPTWLLLSRVTDWRWYLEQETSPWYPSMRLFRQRRYGDWEEVLGRVADALVRERPEGASPASASRFP